MTEPDLRHLFRMTDDTGIFQHSLYGIPNPTEGYTTDDNARALILAGMLYGRSPQKKYEELLYRYMQFLVYAEKDRWFRNFMGYDRNFLEKRGSEDCFGRCIFALGYTVSNKQLPSSLHNAASRLLHRTAYSCESLTYMKSKAYALCGLALWGDSSVQENLKLLSNSVYETYLQCRRTDWQWFEEKITYCSSILPLCMLFASRVLHEDKFLDIGTESLDFLLKVTMKQGFFKPVGCKGWYEKDGIPAAFDEQPVEACGMMLTCREAYHLTENQEYRQAAEKCLNWYFGENSLGLSLLDPETGGCHDGLTETGLNGNEGAESLLCCLIGQLLADSESYSLLP